MKDMNHLIKEPTRFRSSNSSWISILTKRQPFLIQTVKTGISNHHSLICTFALLNILPKFIYIKSYSNYNKEEFENVLKQRLVSSSNFEEFFDTFLATLKEYGPLKKKKFDIIIKSLWVNNFVQLSRNGLSCKIHSTRKDLLETGKITSDSVISVQIYWSQLKRHLLEI